MQDNGLLGKIKVSWIATTIALIVLAYLGFVVYQNFGFRLLDTNPGVGSVATISPFFKINFNKPLNAKSVSLTTTDGFMNGYSVSGKTITIQLQYPLNENLTYTVHLKSVSSTGGKIITGQTFTIQPRVMLSSELPKDQQEALINAQDKITGAVADPIIAHLPYTTPDFTLSTLISGDEANQSHLILEATLYLSNADMGDPTSAENTYEQEVRSYIQSLKLNPDKYNIQYTVNQP